MFKINLIIVLIFSVTLFFINCTPYTYPTTDSKTEIKKPEEIKKYSIKFSVTDRNNKPIQNAQVIIHKFNSVLENKGIPDTLYTDSLGYVIKIVTPTKERMSFKQYGLLIEYKLKLLGVNSPSSSSLSSTLETTMYHYFFDVTVTKDGYYSYSKREMEYGSDNEEKTVNIDIKLSKSIDYFSISFLLSKNDILREKILSFIEVIRLQSLIQSAQLKFFSINKVDFKDKSYLSIGFEHLVTFNSLKLNKYDIGKRIFDDVIRKILSPLNEYIYSPTDFWGYDLTVDGSTKDFSDKSKNSTTLVYRFLIPAETVKSYKNLDITGQQLLDNSIILLDNERIELHLQ